MPIPIIFALNVMLFSVKMYVMSTSILISIYHLYWRRRQKSKRVREYVFFYHLGRYQRVLIFCFSYLFLLARFRCWIDEQTKRLRALFLSASVLLAFLGGVLFFLYNGDMWNPNSDGFWTFTFLPDFFSWNGLVTSTGMMMLGTGIVLCIILLFHLKDEGGDDDFEPEVDDPKKPGGRKLSLVR